jgi:chemotaxis protein CheC
MDSSVLNEMANITSGAYANSIATLTGLFVNIGTPNQIPGKVSEIIKLPLNEFVKPGEKVLVVDEEFTIDDEHISSNMILALESESLEKLFSRLGVQL